MTLNSGTRLGPFEITGLLGAGGMGEVYRATDTNLKRDVAIKILPEEVSRDRDRLARFEREAHALASLNHPHIASIYGLEESDGVPCLVLELVEGQTLAECLKEGGLPIEKALGLARQIASALEAAHEKGVIHRDLKPANIKVTPEGSAKVLDFGLAKAFADEPAEISGDLSQSPTLTAAATRAGVVLGTAAYMSPEQARGKRVDKRTDVWAFGCVLFEMLTGRQAFAGETASDAIARILERDPDWQALPAKTPLKIRELLRRCLTKEHRDRLHDIADARIEIGEAMAGPSAADGAMVHHAGRKTIATRGTPWIIAVAAVSLLIWNNTRDTPTGASRPIRSSLDLPVGAQIHSVGALALSPDGRRLVVVAVNPEGRVQLYVRELTRDEFVPVQGTEGARYPFFSPDGEWVGFTDYDDYTMKKVAVAGGEPVVICDKVDPGGGTWGVDDQIIFARTWSGGLWQVPASGGVPEPIDPPESSEEVRSELWPQPLPGGSAILYTNFGASLDSSRVMVFHRETGERKVLVESAVSGRYAPSGHLLYLRRNTVFAQPFDVERLELTGPPVPTLDDVRRFKAIGLGVFTFSLDGTVAYIRESILTPPRRLVWVDRDGSESAAAEEAGNHIQPSVSPDGGRLLLESAEGPLLGVWIHDLVRDVRTRLTLGTEIAGGPIWTPDGRRAIYYQATPRFDLFWSPADGSQPGELLYGDEQDKIPDSVSPDGRTLLFGATGDQETGYDIWQLPLEGKRESTPLVRTPFTEWGAMFSPDGHWIAFVSNESGESEVYVQSFPDSHGKILVSNDGGVSPVWARDGTELFYRNVDKMMAVDVETVPTFAAGKPRLLFTGRYFREQLQRAYDVAPDGRFLMLKIPPELAPRQVNIVLNWFEELERLAPTP